ncbi:glycosyltransferase [Candidatus Peregrinibacteria bacterium CG10_big_fil_rev_8_21_14_0_10_36_19]|nr:MAG: glycosyltransferase [Candidatus Peregrinibacteria bacterium CG10_big_fil_rev_8_21_14_0_10_36_19]
MQKILKVKIDATTLKSATKKAIEFAESVNQHIITTPNAEIILEAQKSEKFLTILNRSDLNIADGISLLWAAKYQEISKGKYNLYKIMLGTVSLLSIIFYPKFIHSVLPERVTGADLMDKICEEAGKRRHLRIFLLGGAEQIAEITKENLERKYPNINIVGTYSCPHSENQKSIELIQKSNANILFVAFGAPKQELWISKNLKNIPRVKLALGVGGAFDFISQNKKRAPKWMRKTGLEWLFRLIQEPKRIKRIYNATIKFPTEVIKRSLD